MKSELSKSFEHHEMPNPSMPPTVELCKKISTNDSNGNPNGFVIEVAKNSRDIQQNTVEGDKSVETTVYVTTVDPGGFKGYHGHKIRTSTYTLVSGEAEVHFLNPVEKKLYVYEMDAAIQPVRIVSSPGYYLALVSRNNSCAMFVGVPNPPYNAKVNEQVELSSDSVLAALKDGSLSEERFTCTSSGVDKLINNDVR